MKWWYSPSWCGHCQNQLGVIAKLSASNAAQAMIPRRDKCVRATGKAIGGLMRTTGMSHQKNALAAMRGDH